MSSVIKLAHCTSCGQPLDNHRAGFIVCPHCGTVNIAEDSEADNGLPVVSFPTKPRKKHPADMLSILRRVRPAVSDHLLTTVCVVAVAFVVPVWLFFENVAAQSLLAQAQRSIAAGNYDTALGQLNEASGLFSLPSAHESITALLSTDLRWSKDNQDLQTAQLLFAQHNYNAATTLLLKIHTDFPGYEQVAKLLITDSLPESTTLPPGIVQSVVNAIASYTPPAAAPSPSPNPSQPPAAAPSPTVTFYAIPSTVTSGGTVKLYWSSANATSCSATGGWNGTEPTLGNWATAALHATTTFNLTCTGTGGTSSASTTVTVTPVPPPPPGPSPTVTITASPATVTSGAASTLTWNTMNATACTASNAWTGTKPTNGTSSTGWLFATATYALACTGPNGTATASTTVKVTYIAPAPNVKSYGLSLSNPEWLSATEINNRMAQAQAVGAKWVRFTVQWCGIQGGGPNSYNWGPTDTVVNMARAHGLFVLANVTCTPGWANGGKAWNYPPTNTNMVAWANFNAKVAARYVPLGVLDYEIWNEENNSAFWQPAPNAATYATMLQSSYKALKSVSGHTVVVTGGLTISGSSADPKPVTYLQSLYTDGIHGYFDVVGWHPYSDPQLASTTATGWAYMIQGHAIMQAHGDGAKPIWNTEYGVPSTGATWTSEAHQSTGVTDAVNTWKSLSWSGAFFWYAQVDYQDPNPGQSYGTFFGLNRKDWSRKPAWYTFQQIAH